MCDVVHRLHVYFLSLQEITLDGPLWNYIVFWFTLSVIVSPVSILLVAVYQLITIRIDPFGARHIITTPRCFGACIATWVLASGPSALVAFIPTEKDRVVTTAILIATFLIITGICYTLIYRSIARSRPGWSEHQIRQRENKKVLRTFGLVFGSTFISWSLVAILTSVRVIMGGSDCSLVSTVLYGLEWLMYILNWIANNLIYWWRLKEFRSVAFSVVKFSNITQRNASIEIYNQCTVEATVAEKMDEWRMWGIHFYTF